MTVREAILKLVDDKFKIETARVCIVQSVNIEEHTAELKSFDTEADLTSVRLQADKGTGMLLIPKVGSMVVAVEVHRFEYAIVMFSDLDSIQFLDGSYGGVVKVESLVSKLNSIENLVNDIKTKFNAHTHSGNGVVTTSIITNQSLSITDKDDLQNPLVTHGKV